MHEAYHQTFVVRWADVDANGHMKNTAYLDTCVDTRFGFFASQGLAPTELARLQIGPVVRHDEVDYHRELRFLDSFTVDITLAGISDDASRFSIQNRFFRPDGILAARVVSTGGWLHLGTRQLIAPPEAVRGALLVLPKAEGFRALESSIR